MNMISIIHNIHIYKIPDSPKPRKLRASDGSRLLVEFKEWSVRVWVKDGGYAMKSTGLPSNCNALMFFFYINNNGFSMVLPSRIR